MPEYVNWLRHASPYINAHRDCTFVVMLPGDGVAHPNFGNIVHDLVLLHGLGVRLVLVHGSRPQIEAVWRSAASPRAFIATCVLPIPKPWNA